MFRLKIWQKEKRECFDVVSARAVAKLSILLELCVPFVKMDHTMVALKGKNGHEELISAQKAIDTLGVELIDEEKFMIEEGYYYIRQINISTYGQIKKKTFGGLSMGKVIAISNQKKWGR